LCPLHSVHALAKYLFCFAKITFKASLNNPAAAESSRLRTHLSLEEHARVLPSVTGSADWLLGYPLKSTSRLLRPRSPGSSPCLLISSPLPPFLDDPLGSHPLSVACRHKQLCPFPMPRDCHSGKQCKSFRLIPYIGLQAQLFRRVSNNDKFLMRRLGRLSG
jgi:hypothetical protein